MALSTIIASGIVHLAMNRQEMTQGISCVGFQDEFGDLWILKDESYIAVRDYMQRLRKRFPFDMAKILKSLSELGCIESFSNGKSKTYNRRIDGRTYFKVNGERFRELIDKNQG